MWKCRAGPDIVILSKDFLLLLLSRTINSPEAMWVTHEVVSYKILDKTLLIYTYSETVGLKVLIPFPKIFNIRQV